MLITLNMQLTFKTRHSSVGKWGQISQKEPTQFVLMRPKPFLERFSCPLPINPLILRWLKTGTVAWSSVDGLALVPDTTTARTMYALGNGSTVVIRLRSTTSETGDTHFYERVCSCRSCSVHFAGQLPQRLYYRTGGAALRTRLDFDLSRLPPFVVIHRAELVLNVDTIRSTISNLGLPLSVQLYPAQNAVFPAAQRAFQSQRNSISAVSATGFF